MPLSCTTELATTILGVHRLHKIHTLVYVLPAKAVHGFVLSPQALSAFEGMTN